MMRASCLGPDESKPAGYRRDGQTDRWTAFNFVYIDRLAFLPAG